VSAGVYAGRSHSAPTIPGRTRRYTYDMGNKVPPSGKPRRGRGSGALDAADRGGVAGSQGGGFFRRPEEMLAAIGAEAGAETEEAVRRFAELARNPRSLTDDARSQLHANLAPVLRDIRVTGAIVPDVREEAHEDLGADMVSAWIQRPDGIVGTGVRVDMTLPPEERLADIAEQLQEWEMEELAAADRSATWPECPEHPGSHPLSPRVQDGAAVWCCPRTGHVEYPIGGVTTTR